MTQFHDHEYCITDDGVAPGCPNFGEDDNWPELENFIPCGAVYDEKTPPCSKPADHENGPDTDWKRHLHSNGTWKWPAKSQAPEVKPQ